MANKKRSRKPGKRGKLYRCERGHIRCDGGAACEKAYLLACGIGAPTAWKPEYNEEIVKHFQVDEVSSLHYDDKGRPYPIMKNKFPTFEGFAGKIGVSVDTLYEWAKAKHSVESDEKCIKYPGFSEAFRLAHNKQALYIHEAAMSGAANTTYAIFFAKNNLGMRDTTDLTNDGGKFESPTLVDYSQKPYDLKP